MVQQSTVDYSRKWYVMAAVAMSIFLATIDGSIVNVALPTLVQSFGTEFAIVEWVVLAYLLTLATLMLSVGRLGDMIGKKTPFLVGFVVFTVGSALCGLAPTVYALIAARVFQAIGATALMALGAAIITEAFPPIERGRALGITGTMVSVGIVIGPVIGGLLIAALSWHWIFFVNLPIGVVGIVIAARFVPNTKPAGGQRFDYLGAITLFVSLLGLLLGLTFAQQIGFQPIVWALLATWLIFLALFLVAEARVHYPMVDLALFQSSLFNVNLITGFLCFVAISGTIILMPFYLENVLGYAPQALGLLMAVTPIMAGILAPISGELSDRFGTRNIMVIGLAVLLVGFYGVSTLGEHTSALGYVLRFVPIGIGLGIFQSPNNSVIMGSVPRHRLGVASGLLAITRTLGQTAGIATLSALWASRVMAHTNRVLPGGATTAPAPIQVAAMSDTFLVAAGLIALALALSLWGGRVERET
jgi:EmrB/QacA subfamily drug resistance transporter